MASAKCGGRNHEAQLTRARARLEKRQFPPEMSGMIPPSATYAKNQASAGSELASTPLPENRKEKQTLTIATGSAGWEYNRTGKEICRQLIASEHFRCQSLVTHGSLENIHLLQEAKVNLALSQSDMIPADSLDFISLKTLARQTLYVFVRKDSNIERVHDLMDKRVNTGPIGSGLRGTMNNVLAAAGVVPSEESNITAAKEADLLCDNQTDAISFILDIDAPQVDQIKETCRMRRLALSRETLKEVMRMNSTYYPINLKSSGQKEGYAIGLQVDLVTYKGALPPEDHQLILDSLRKMP
ncbi:TAXI family TRAP transporter solute-binding subunit [Myxococcota bacterium]|nr:TAXI family TRAP transporter solute-binding subunit [Myxococcota bacterium]